MTLEDAKLTLRIDTDDNDDLIESLIDSLPDYIYLTTGMKEEDQSGDPLVETVSGFLIKLWYYGDQADEVRLQRTINNLLKAISLKVNYPDPIG